MITEPKEKKPLYKQWWLWTAVALVVVLVMVLVVTLDNGILCACMRLGCKPKDGAAPKGYETVLEKTVAVKDIDYESAYDNGFLDIYSPKDVKGNQPTVLYIHGGYYVGGGKASAEAYCRLLAAEGFVVASMDYALAPENTYPTQTKQVDEALSFLIANKDTYHIDPKQLFLGGDSAGCHLAAQMAAIYTNSFLASKMKFTTEITSSQIKGVLLLCGFFDMDTVRECKFPLFDTAMWALTGVRDYRAYGKLGELSVVDYVTESYPAAFITCGSDDPFYSQAEQMRDVLTEKGVKNVAYLPKSAKNKLKHEFQRDFTLDESYVALEQAVEFLKANSKFDIKAETQDKQPEAVFVLDTGDTFVVRLFPQYAPETVANFIRYADDGFYNGTIFHRIIPNQVLQGGGYTASGYKAPTYGYVKGEFAANGFTGNTLSHVAGVISMARAQAYDSATSQFFFCSVDITAYDGQYAAFGVITEGAEALPRLTAAAVNGDEPVNPVTLISVTIRYI